MKLWGFPSLKKIHGNPRVSIHRTRKQGDDKLKCRFSNFESCSTQKYSCRHMRLQWIKQEKLHLQKEMNFSEK